MAHQFNPDSFEGQVLQRLTAVEVEVRNLKDSLAGKLNHHRVDLPIAGGVGGALATAVFVLARLLGLL